MTGKRSYHTAVGRLTASQQRRFKRDQWYRTSNSAPNETLVEVWSDIAMAVKAMARAQAVHVDRGFANLSSMAILLGGLGVLAPSRRPDIARLGLKAVLAGTLSNFMSATLVGIFFALSGAAIA